MLKPDLTLLRRGDFAARDSTVAAKTNAAKIRKTSSLGTSSGSAERLGLTFKLWGLALASAGLRAKNSRSVLQGWQLAAFQIYNVGLRPTLRFSLEKFKHKMNGFRLG